MKVGLENIAGIRKDSPSTASLFESWQATITGGWSIDHRPDGGHGPIHERGRTLPLGEWKVTPFYPGLFVASGGATWTVSNAAFISIGYMISGKTMTMRFYIETSTIATAAPAQLFIVIPDNYRAALMTFGTMLYDDNGTIGTGMVYTPTTLSGGLEAYNNRVLGLTTDLRATVNWTISAALTVAGCHTFEITG